MLLLLYAKHAPHTKPLATHRTCLLYIQHTHTLIYGLMWSIKTGLAWPSAQPAATKRACTWVISPNDHRRRRLCETNKHLNHENRHRVVALGHETTRDTASTATPATTAQPFAGNCLVTRGSVCGARLAAVRACCHRTSAVVIWCWHWHWPLPRWAHCDDHKPAYTSRHIMRTCEVSFWEHMYGRSRQIHFNRYHFRTTDSELSVSVQLIYILLRYNTRLRTKINLENQIKSNQNCILKRFYIFIFIYIFAQICLYKIIPNVSLQNRSDKTKKTGWRVNGYIFSTKT